MNLGNRKEVGLEDNIQQRLSAESYTWRPVQIWNHLGEVELMNLAAATPRMQTITPIGLCCRDIN